MKGLVRFALFAALLPAACGNDATGGNEQPMFTLSNGIEIPLIGMGIGNLPHGLIPSVVQANLQPDIDVRLIDTAHASHNEALLGESIAEAIGTRGEGGSTRGAAASSAPPIHIVTKVWYTHLGYERTKLSVEESLQNLSSALPASSNRLVYVHMLLHWPRCRDDIPWMNCEREEDELPPEVKSAGPPPHLDKDNAWKQSWQALEDAYHEHQTYLQGSLKQQQQLRRPILASIGVSNFDYEDMKELISLAKIQPHFYQGNSWAIFHDPYLLNLLRDYNIFFQSYGLMNGFLSRGGDAPAAYSVLTNTANALSNALEQEENKNATEEPQEDLPIEVTEGMVLLSFILKKNIGIIPRASTPSHQFQNSPESLMSLLPHMTEERVAELDRVLPSLMRGEPIHASVFFMNSLAGPIQIHWLHEDTGEEVLVAEKVEPGSVEVMESHPGHKFVAYDTERDVRREFLVEVGYGEQQHFHVEL